jgi:hypothetical protein
MDYTEEIQDKREKDDVFYLRHWFSLAGGRPCEGKE